MRDIPFIAFASHAGQLERLSALVPPLRRADIEVDVWVADGLDADAARRTEAFRRVVNLSAGAATAPPAAAWDIVSRFINQDAAQDRVLSGRSAPDVDFWPQIRRAWPYDKVLTLGRNVTTAVAAEIANQEPLAVFGETNSLVYRIVYRTCRALNVPHLRPQGLAHSGGRMYFEDGLGSEWEDVVAQYEALACGAQVAPADVDADAAAIVEAIRDGRPAAVANLKPATGLSVARVSSMVREARRQRRRRDQYGISPRVVSPTLVSPAAKARRYVDRALSARTLAQLASNDLPASFASLFLHVQPEFTVEGAAFEYQNQAAVARNIAAGLPAGVELVVREHPAIAGIRPAQVYREIASIPNVRIVNPSVSGHAILRRSTCVLTLTGTAAFEAMCLGVPAVVFGNVYYTAFEGVERWRGLEWFRAWLSDGPVIPSRPAMQHAVRARLMAAHPVPFTDSAHDLPHTSALAAAVISELRVRKRLGS